MDWIVKKVGNIDAERQHLNKILAEIRGAIDSIPAPTTTIERIVEEGDASVNFTLTLSGDASGSVDFDGDDVTLPVTITVDGVEEAPIDSRSYWRRNAEWRAVSFNITSLDFLEGDGFPVTYMDGGEDGFRTWVARSIEGTTNRIDVADGDGVAANPVIDIAPTYVGQTSITTLGTIGTGVWQGTAVGLAYGGTGQNYSTRVANTVWAGPTGGADAAPTFRTLVAADIPSLASIYQPLDATLTELSANNWTANAIPVGDGADSMSQVVIGANEFLARDSVGVLQPWDITDLGIQLLSDPLPSDMRVRLGLVIGSHVQGWDTQLDSLAALAYTGNALKVVRVNAGENGFELAAVSAGSGDVVGPASAVNNNVAFFDGITGKLIKDSGLTLSGSNTGDQTSIVGITGTLAQFNTAITDADILSTAAAAAAYQPLDATLTELAANNWVANSIPIGDAADGMSQVAFAANTFPARASTGNLVAKSITDDALALLTDADVPRIGTTNAWTDVNTWSWASMSNRNRIINTLGGMTAIDQSSGGLFLSCGTLNTTNKYMPGILWGSTDVSLTTTNPKVTAGIVAYATENWTADASGGTGLEFFGLGNAPGTGPSLALTSMGTATVGGGWDIDLATGATAVTQATSDDSQKVATTEFVHDVAALSSAMSYVGGTTIAGAAATTIAVSGLNLDADDIYDIEVNLFNPSVSSATLSLFVNSDTTTTNYDLQALQLSNSTFSNSRVNAATFAVMAATAGNGRVVINIRLTRSALGYVTASIIGSEDSTTGLKLRIVQWSWRTLATNVTGITVSSSVASSIGIGSTLKVWKVSS